MKIETTTLDDFPALVLRGDFETDSAEPFLAAIEDSTSGDPPYVMVVMRYVKYINSTALGAVVRARTNCKDRGGDLAVLQPSKLCREVITKMGLDTVLPLFESPDQVIDYFDGHEDAAPSAAGATEANERNTVMFSFGDNRADLIPGRRRRHCAAVADTVDTEGVTFRWNPSTVGVAQTTMPEMFPIGSTVHVKTQLKLARREFFEADTSVKSISLDGDDVIVVCSWSNIRDADRQDLERHLSEMAFLKDRSSEA